jgi:hypothetical protein
MPERLCFDDNPLETLEVLERLRQKLEPSIRGPRGHKPVSKHRGAQIHGLRRYTTFETIRYISPAAALVLAAEYQRSLFRSGLRAHVVGVEHWDNVVFDTLWKIGFFDLVWADQVEQPDMSASAVVLPMQSGETADPTEVDKLVSGLKMLYPVPDETQEGLVHLYGAMIEAVANVMNHAYPKAWRHLPRSKLRRWWMTGAVDRQNRHTTAVVFDRGISIPVSLPNWAQAEGWLQRMRRKVGMNPLVNDPRSDGEAIAAAVEEAVSSTGEGHRGTGLAQMRNFVCECREGRLRIMSRCGEVVFRPGRQPDVRTYDVPLHGTLIEWNVLL